MHPNHYGSLTQSSPRTTAPYFISPLDHSANLYGPTQFSLDPIKDEYKEPLGHHNGLPGHLSRRHWNSFSHKDILGGHLISDEGASAAPTYSSFTPSRYSKHLPDPQRGSLRGPVKAEITNLEIRYDPPVTGCEIQPYVTLQDERGNTLFLGDLGELKYRWYRGAKRMCSVAQCGKGAKLQCMSCLKLKAPAYASFFCSVEHLKKMWRFHRQLHEDKSSGDSEPGRGPVSWNDIDDDTEDEPTEQWQYALSKSEHEAGLAATQSSANDIYKLSRLFPPMLRNIWADCSTSKTYVPTQDDIGRQLLLECAPVLPSTSGKEPELGAWVRKDTSSVIPEPDPPPARNFVVNPALTSRPDPRNTFKVLCYNVLAEIYATRQLYPYCPMRSLCWNYRRNIVLREIFQYDCDIVCLQEVQQNHFDEFFNPEMAKKGYEGIYKMKTRESLGEDPKCVDGCAVFYKKDRFAVMEQYAIEFNEAAKGSFENSPGDWRAKLRRLSKGNVALVCVLEELRSDLGRGRRKRRICVANTHIYWDPAHADVKLWQTWILCQELQKMVLGRDLPLLLCGDFNSTPESAVYELLSTERLRDDHPVLAQDKLGIFQQGELTHNLPLESSYGTVFGVEPKHTNYTGHFTGCLDYIYYSKNHLQVTGVLDIDNEEVLKEFHALPSTRFASDHLAILSEFAFL